MPLPTRRIGDVSVSAVGLGCMPMSFDANVDERERALATVHRALDLGITFLDTANVYSPGWSSYGHNEALVAEALSTYSGPADLTEVLVATKGGITVGEGYQGRDSSETGLRAAVERSLEQLGVAVIDLYQHHRTDPSLTYLAQLEALMALKDAGLIRRIGLSNVTSIELDLALEVVGAPSEGGIVSVQNEFSPRFRGDADVLQRCTDTGIAFLPWSPLGGSKLASEIGSRYLAFTEVGEEVGASPQETVLAWLLALSPVMVPIPGATRPQSVESIVRSLSVSLDADQMARLTATVPEEESINADPRPRSPLR